jgi:hypothetical protein
VFGVLHSCMLACMWEQQGADYPELQLVPWDILGQQRQAILRQQVVLKARSSTYTCERSSDCAHWLHKQLQLHGEGEFGNVLPGCVYRQIPRGCECCACRTQGYAAAML